jgi:hypothetical protein
VGREFQRRLLNRTARDCRLRRAVRLRLGAASALRSGLGRGASRRRGGGRLRSTSGGHPTGIASRGACRMGR